MSFKVNLFIIISFSFSLLSTSLFLSTSSINDTNKLIDNIKNIHLKFSALSTKINHDIEMNQAGLLSSIILQNTNDITSIEHSFDNLYKLVDTLDEFNKNHNTGIKDVDETIIIMKKRMISYRLVQLSLLNAFKSKDEEDILDALTGSNAVTIKFSQEINKLMDISNNQLQEKIKLLKISNENSKQNTIYLFIISFLLILSAIYKLIKLQNIAQTELKRAEEAEMVQKKLQEQLLKYNDDLEDEISKKTKELHIKMYTHFISGLANRNRLLDDTYRYKFKQMALLNIDKFQKFNDVYGEETGNIALKMTAEFFKEQLSDENTLLYHIGSDEFVIATKDSSTLDNNQFIITIENLLDMYKKEIFIHNKNTFNFMMSAGIAFSGRKKMLAYADMALKNSKSKNIMKMSP